MQLDAALLAGSLWSASLPMPLLLIRKGEFVVRPQRHKIKTMPCCQAQIHKLLHLLLLLIDVWFSGFPSLQHLLCVVWTGTYHKYVFKHVAHGNWVEHYCWACMMHLLLIDLFALCCMCTLHIMCVMLFLFLRGRHCFLSPPTHLAD